MITKRHLTQEEYDYFKQLDIKNIKRVKAEDFKKLTNIVNDVTGGRRRANIGCGACLYDLLQLCNEIYLITEEHLKTQDNGTTKRTQRKPRRKTKRNAEQSNSGSQRSISEAGDNQPAADAEVVGRGRTRRPSESDRLDAENG